MKYMLDTNICIYLIKRRPVEVLDRFRQARIGDLGISSITVSELAYGVEKSQEVERNREALELFLAPLVIAEFDAEAALEAGAIRLALEKAGTPIGAYDLLIAAHAKSLGVILVSNNLREFARVEGLAIENWVG